MTDESTLPDIEEDSDAAPTLFDVEPTHLEVAGDVAAPDGAVDPHLAPTRAITAATRALAMRSSVAAAVTPAPVAPAASPTPPEVPPDTRPRPATGSPPAPLPPLPFPPGRDLGARPRRTLPRKWRIALVVAGALLVLAIVGGHGGRRRQKGPRVQVVADELVVNEEDLRKRKEVAPADFRSRDPRGRVTPALPAPRPAPSAPPEGARELEARRARRVLDPDEINPAPSRRPPASGPQVAVAAPPDARAPRVIDRDRPLYLAPADAAPVGNTEPGTKRGSRAKGAVVISAGTALPASLAAPIVLAGGSSSVVVRIDDDAPQLAGARFLGTATYGRGRVTLRFRTLLLASGQEYDVRAEARGEDGAFGLAAGGGDGGASRSAEAEVAEDTGTDLVSGAVGGLGGSVIRSYARKKRRGGGGQAPTIRLEEGSTLEVFVHETVNNTTNE